MTGKPDPDMVAALIHEMGPAAMEAFEEALKGYTGTVLLGSGGSQVCALLFFHPKDAMSIALEVQLKVREAMNENYGDGEIQTRVAAVPNNPSTNRSN